MSPNFCANGVFDLTKLEVLKKYFGHERFREAQEQLIDSILSGRDCFGVMPTGAGKSVCYQVPSIMLDGTAIVISPLISLMKDQVEALIQNGVKAACINSSLDEIESYEIYNKAAEGQLDILYVAPERLGTPRFSELVHRMKISLVAVDEAHCVSHWGQDFRPSYLNISGFIASLPERPVVSAFTATATERVKRDIVNILGLRQPLQITTGFDRPNLFFEVRTPEDKEEELLKLLREGIDGSVIVYCSTRKTVESVCNVLKRNGIRAGAYHAGFSPEQRSRVQEDFLFDRLDVIAATNAFGMGIDKSNVRLVVHYNCPKDLESYYQEAGRAGRDGGNSRCVIFYSGADTRLALYMIKNSHNEAHLDPKERDELIRRDKERLNAMTSYCKTKKCLRSHILGYFGEAAKSSSCGYCGNCTKGDVVTDITVEAQKIISCVFRLKQRNKALPVAGLCGVLHGDLEGDVETLSTYGIMRGDTPDRIIKITKYLCGKGYIEECGDRKVCVLTPKADEFIDNHESVFMRFGSVKKEKPAENHSNPELFEKLRELRKKLASSLGVPPYVVFSDVSLWSMCTILPRNIEEFLNVSGVGSIKAERYGRKFLAVINEYVNVRGK